MFWFRPSPGNYHDFCGLSHKNTELSLKPLTLLTNTCSKNVSRAQQSCGSFQASHHLLLSSSADVTHTQKWKEEAHADVSETNRLRGEWAELGLLGQSEQSRTLVRVFRELGWLLETHG